MTPYPISAYVLSIGFKKKRTLASGTRLKKGS